MRFRLFALGAAIVALLTATAALAATTIVVTPANPQGFSTADTRPGGAVGFVVDATAPSGIGALQLTTDNTNAAKAQYIKAVDNLPIGDVTELSYYTKQNSASFAGGDASFQLLVNLLGDAGGFTTFVYEPYENGVVVPGDWQSWDVDAGQFWSSKSVNCSNGSTTAGMGGPPFYELGDIEALCPEAVVVGIGVNVGSYNPAYDVEADLVSLNGTAYDFEPYAVATAKDDCKKGGWENLRRAGGSSFKNQGDCIQYVNTGK